MSALVYLTQAPTKIGLAGSRQMIQNAVDVSAYRHISLLLEVLAYVGAPGNFEVTVITGMQLDTEDGWVELGTFGSQSTDGQCWGRFLCSPRRTSQTRPAMSGWACLLL